MNKNIYETPLNSRYASAEMKQIFSPDKKFKTWRKLWITLAKAEKELGLDITDEQIEELEKFENNINYEIAEEREKITRHDVMAHIYAYGVQCPKAKGIIHLGATSCYVGDNTDIIVMKEAMELIKSKVLTVIKNLSSFALKYKDLPTLGFTHFQSAQLTTVGKRACLWIQDLMMDLETIDFCLENIKLLGSKGTTGTQASFMELFNNDSQKVKKLDMLIAEKLGFKGVFAVSGQTYSRKLDSIFLNALSGIAQSATKFSNDMRLLQHLKEMEEPFESGQVGSSAMAYKRNPMRSERIAGLARYIIVDTLNPAITASSQWFERTLDDSANKRIAIPEAFLATDAILNIYMNVTENFVVYPKVIEKHIMEELPFMATENIMMNAVKQGGDRQELHEKIREHSMEASKVVKIDGKKNDLIERIVNDLYLIQI
ncbi:MAG: adenylosuccinate lyase [Eubacteriales bacterium]|nr:adenylosuccinate lyase [Eubacteriales bacterium]